MQLKYLNFFIGSGILFRAGVVAHWLDCQPTNLEMRGSNPTDCWAFLLPLTNPIFIVIQTKCPQGGVESKNENCSKLSSTNLRGAAVVRK